MNFFLCYLIAEILTHFLKRSKTFLCSLNSKNSSMLKKKNLAFFISQNRNFKVFLNSSKTQICKVFSYLSKTDSFEN